MTKQWFITIVAVLLSSNALALNKNREPTPPDVVTPTVKVGAAVFAQRCTLCHGNVGMGEGVMATALKDYPSTNLRNNKHGTSKKQIREAILYGGMRGAMHNAMPPFADELTWVDLQSVIKFMTLYYKDVDSAVDLVRNAKVTQPAKRELGRIIFERRCTLCHGKKGDGKGKMARIIKNPPPFDLTKSAAPDDYLLKIISDGGEKMSRSPKMPTFGGELSEGDIRSVILYIKGFREP